MRIDQFVVAVLLDRFHELFTDSDRDVEVVELSVVLLRRNEIEDIGMVDTEDRHVGAAPRSSLLYSLSGGVEDRHERDRSARDALGRLDPVVLRTDAREGESRASSTLVYQRRVLDRLEYAFHRVVNRKDEAGRELLEFAAGVHQSRGIGKKIEGGHHVIERIFPAEAVLVVTVTPLG